MHRILKYDITPSATGALFKIPVDSYTSFTPLHVQCVEGRIYLWARTAPATDASKPLLTCLIRTVWTGAEFELRTMTYLGTTRDDTSGLVYHVHYAIL